MMMRLRQCWYCPFGMEGCIYMYFLYQYKQFLLIGWSIWTLMIKNNDLEEQTSDVDGIWMGTCLIPLLSSCINYNNNNNNNNTSVTVVHISSLLFALFSTHHYLNILASLFILLCWTHMYCDGDVRRNTLYSIFWTFGMACFQYIMKIAPTKEKEKRTVMTRGEYNVLLSLTCWICSHWITTSPTQDMELYLQVIEASFVGYVMSTLSYFLLWKRSSYQLILWNIACIWYTVYTTLTQQQSHNHGQGIFLPFTWLYEFLLSTPNVLLIIGYWILSIVGIVIPITYYICFHSLQMKVTVKRKVYHFIAILLFGPPTYTSPQIMSVAYTIAILCLLLLESIRPPQLFQHLLDPTKDNNEGIVTSHIYLLLGCSLPLYLSLTHPATTVLLPYSGLIVLGMGDAMAAIVGTHYGTTKWFPSLQCNQRSMEGSLAMLLSTYILSSKFAILVTLLEACTTQIDNLCLPILFIISLQPWQQ